MSPRFFLLFLTSFAVLGAASWYLLRRSAAAFALGPIARRAGAATLFGALVVSALARVLERRLPATVLEPFAVVGFTVVLGATISAAFLAALDLVAAAARLPARLRKDPALPALALAAPAPPAEAAPALPRRAFLAQAAAGSALAFGGGTALYGAAIGRHDYQIEEVPIRIAGLPRALDGFTLVQLSDVHLGLFVGEREIRAAEDLVRRARPDLLVLTGDLLDHDAREAEALGRMIARLSPLSRGGVIAVPGNHDYYAGIDAVADIITRSGARLLRNEGVVIGGPSGRHSSESAERTSSGFALLGVDDVWGPRIDRRAVGPDLDRALASLPEARDLPRVLLCHNPATFTENAGKVALQLSGHTHGGQLNLGVRPADVVLGHPYIAGRYERAGSQIYVNRGFGTAGPPARIGAPPEVSRIVLVAA